MQQKWLDWAEVPPKENNIDALQISLHSPRMKTTAVIGQENNVSGGYRTAEVPPFDRLSGQNHIPESPDGCGVVDQTMPL